MNTNFENLLNDLRVEIEKNSNFLFTNGGHKCDNPDYSEGYDMGVASITDNLIDILTKYQTN